MMQIKLKEKPGNYTGPNGLIKRGPATKKHGVSVLKKPVMF